jgi:hypothetical protein
MRATPRPMQVLFGRVAWQVLLAAPGTGRFLTIFPARLRMPAG